jgi:peptidoglycan/xylan/chitin deacetylase (PgdA/CDA1 family)
MTATLLQTLRSSTGYKTAAFAPRAAWMALRSLAGAPKSVWLTFDDGPHATHTAKILKVLEKRSIRATFFFIGRHALNEPGLVRDAFEAGHRIGNHSFTHPDLRTLGRSAIRDEIARTEDALGPYLGREKLFRPPHGARNAEVDAVASELGYHTVLWSVSTRDWSESYQPDRWVRHGARLAWLWDESRILLHDNQQTTADHLDAFLDRLERINGIRFMPPESVLRPGFAPKPPASAAVRMRARRVVWSYFSADATFELAALWAPLL